MEWRCEQHKLRQLSCLSNALNTPQVVDNDGLHGMNRVSGSHSLTAGQHVRLDVLFFLTVIYLVFGAVFIIFYSFP